MYIHQEFISTISLNWQLNKLSADEGHEMLLKALEEALNTLRSNITAVCKLFAHVDKELINLLSHTERIFYCAITCH